MAPLFFDPQSVIRIRHSACLQSAICNLKSAIGSMAQPAIIINAASGADDKERFRDELVAMFSARGLVPQILLVKDGDRLQALAERMLKQGHSPIVAGGGDGTISAVASVLAGGDTPLGVLPLGTLNHFAKDLKVPLDLEGAVQVITEGSIAEIDVAEVNGHVFINNSSLGLYPSIVHQREQQQQRLGRGKWTAFFWAALSVLRRYPFINVRLTVDNVELNRRTPFVFIGNNEYEMEGVRIGARACLNGGKLSLQVAHRTGRWGLVRFAIRALFGGLRNEKDLDVLCASEIWVETRHQRLRVATDGEVSTMETPLHYRIRPGALRVLVGSRDGDSSQGK
jgi:diacylglycerol kinase family enzyme